MSLKSFKTPFLVSEWKEVFTTRSCLSVAFLLPCGCHDDYKLSVTENGSVLQVRVTWPEPMTNVRVLHHLWLVLEKGSRVSKDHGKLGGFETALRALRQSPQDPVHSFCTINLPFKVETQIEEEALCWPELGVYIVYAELKEALDLYTSTSSVKKKFKVMSQVEDAAAAGPSEISGVTPVPL